MNFTEHDGLIQQFGEFVLASGFKHSSSSLLVGMIPTVEHIFRSHHNREHTCVYIDICMYVHVHTYIYIYIHTTMYIYIYIHTLDID